MFQILWLRSIENEKERLITILIAPFMSCSARLPVYALFVGVFFKEYQSLIVLSLYLIGILIALFSSTFMNKFILKNEDSVLSWNYQHIVYLQLERYGVVHGKRQKVLKKAGTFIFGGSVVIWALTYMGPNGFDVKINQSFMHILGEVFAPIIAPLGFGTWQAATLIPGF